MIIVKKKTKASGIRFSLRKDGKEIGRAFLYILSNNFHKEPFGFLEDVFINPEAQGQGLGSELVKAVIKEAKRQKCYKLVGTSRYARQQVHKFYEKLGFKNYGIEFRIDF